MNNAQNNWFYKMCVKQCVKDVALVAGGVICFVIAIMLFGAHVIGIINFAFMALGILMIIRGASALFSKLPKLRGEINMMSPAELAQMGQMAPQCIAKTFYFTEGFLCAPVSYAIIPYYSIADVHLNAWTYRGHENGYFVNIEFNDGTPAMDIPVKDMTFRSQFDNFIMMIEQHKNNRG